MRTNIIRANLPGTAAMLEAKAESLRHDEPGHVVLTVPSADNHEVDSRRLLQGQREVVIRHGGECYRLRHTRNDKLILTK